MKYLTVACLLNAASPLAAADDDADRIEFVIDNVVFVMLHEFSHLIIEDFDVPVLGNSEDAADTLAAVSLIRLDRARPEGDFRLIRSLFALALADRRMRTGMATRASSFFVISLSMLSISCRLNKASKSWPTRSVRFTVTNVRIEETNHES